MKLIRSYERNTTAFRANFEIETLDKRMLLEIVEKVEINSENSMQRYDDDEDDTYNSKRITLFTNRDTVPELKTFFNIPLNYDVYNDEPIPELGKFYVYSKDINTGIKYRLIVEYNSITVDYTFVSFNVNVLAAFTEYAEPIPSERTDIVITPTLDYEEIP